MTHSDLQQSIRTATEQPNIHEAIAELLKLQCQLLWEILEEMRKK
jgi:hypothetical protein